MSQTLTDGKSGIQLKRILLNESLFSLKDYNDIPDPKDFSMNVSFSHNIEDSNYAVKVTVVIRNDKNAEESNLNVSVTMTGLFEKESPLPFPDDQFVKVNGPAIIYPYIRQHIRMLSLDSGIPPILLPVVNFSALYEERLKGEN